MVGAGLISHWHLTTHHRTASQLIFLREAARTAANCAQPIILAYGTCASAKVSRHSAGAWVNAHPPSSKSTYAIYTGA